MTARKATQKSVETVSAIPQGTEPYKDIRQPFVLQSAVVLSELDRQRRDALSEIEAIEADILSIHERANRDIAAINERKESEIAGRNARKDDLELTVKITSAGIGARE